MPIDSDAPRYYHILIEWQTYTPDGRVLTVAHAGDRWCVACDGRRAEGGQLVDALRDAVGQERGEGLIVGAAGSVAVEQWIRETAAQIVGETPH